MRYDERTRDFPQCDGIKCTPCKDFNSAFINEQNHWNDHHTIWQSLHADYYDEPKIGPSLIDKAVDDAWERNR